MSNTGTTQPFEPPLEFRQESRLALLKDLDLETLKKDQVFREIVDEASAICRDSMVLMSVVDHTEEFVVASRGFDHDVIPLQLSFCKTAINERRILIVEDATEDPRFCDNPFVTGPANLRFYVGIPVLAGRRVPIGMLCILDTETHRLSISDRAALFGLVHRLEARFEHHIDNEVLNRILRRTAEIALRESHEMQRMKDVLVGHMLHDLVNKTSCIKSDAKFARRDDIEGDALAEVLEDIEACVTEVATMLGDVRHLALNKRGVLPCDESILVSELLDQVSRPKTELLTLDDQVESGVVWGNRKLLKTLLDSLCQHASDLVGRDISVTITITGIEGSAGTEASTTSGERHRADPIEAHVPETFEFCEMIARAHGGRIVVRRPHSTSRVFSVELPEAPES